LLWRRAAVAWVEYAKEQERYVQGLFPEKPAHEVTISRPFYLGRFEVTGAQWYAVFEGALGPYGDDLWKPMGRVSWLRAREFCKALSEKTGRTVRLPTEAEWEYAARAGTRTNYYTGDSVQDLERAGWWGSCRPQVPGEKQPNAFGLYDMLGNVEEWCEDSYSSLRYLRWSKQDPTGPSYDDFKVVRGGSSFSSYGECRCATRRGSSPGKAWETTGFRVAMDALLRKE
jgi:formylglycine-generating enzyme required for sulfatase activity